MELVEHKITQKTFISFSFARCTCGWSSDECRYKNELEYQINEHLDGVNAIKRKPIYVAHIDEVPSLGLTPHEMADEVSSEVIVAMWDALKNKYEELKEK
jgi:hypothetical protein